MKYDFLIVGAGLAGAMCAHYLSKQGKTCVVIDKDNEVGGMCKTESIDGIDVHLYGAHIFRTNSKDCWDFVNSICEFVPFVNSPLALSQGELFNLPFNMNTFNKLWGCNTPKEAQSIINSERENFVSPQNLEEHALSLVGKTIYTRFIKEYTEKQWGCTCRELPPSTMQRIPLRFTYDNNYYNEIYQGIPKKGYTYFIKRLLEGSKVLLNTDYLDDIWRYNSMANHIIYTGRIDALFDYKYGKLDYRSVEFKHEKYDVSNKQGNAVINYSDKEYPYTRTIEHKHFTHTESETTIVSYEYPVSNDIDGSVPPSYPIHTDRNVDLFNKYKRECDKLDNLSLFGRLAEYKYYSMNDIIEKFV